MCSKAMEKGRVTICKHMLSWTLRKTKDIMSYCRKKVRLDDRKLTYTQTVALYQHRKEEDGEYVKKT